MTEHTCTVDGGTSEDHCPIGTTSKQGSKEAEMSRPQGTGWPRITLNTKLYSKLAPPSSAALLPYMFIAHPHMRAHTWALAPATQNSLIFIFPKQ